MNPDMSGEEKSHSKGEEAVPNFDMSDFKETTESIESVDVSPEIAIADSPSPTTKKSSSNGDLNKNTVPQLKEMLRKRGLKVSGKKGELIDRLMQGQN
jgi:3-deoxy-D-arabino-heptulosonate 7-phosphate (DAHP) synthase